MRPKIAIISDNALMNIGLKTILERLIPVAEVCSFRKFEDMHDEESFFHFFVSAKTFAEHNRFFSERTNKVIVIVSSESTLLPNKVHTLNVSNGEDVIVKDILKLHQHAHGDGHLTHAGNDSGERETRLSQRECDVLGCLVRGMLNKEIADTLAISINTVITHRRNITDKLGTRSVAALTIYAVTHGIVDIENI